MRRRGLPEDQEFQKLRQEQAQAQFDSYVEENGQQSPNKKKTADDFYNNKRTNSQANSKGSRSRPLNKRNNFLAGPEDNSKPLKNPLKDFTAPKPKFTKQLSQQVSNQQSGNTGSQKESELATIKGSKISKLSKKSKRSNKPPNPFAGLMGAKKAPPAKEPPNNPMNNQNKSQENILTPDKSNDLSNNRSNHSQIMQKRLANLAQMRARGNRNRTFGAQLAEKDQAFDGLDQDENTGSQSGTVQEPSNSFQEKFRNINAMGKNKLSKDEEWKNQLFDEGRKSMRSSDTISGILQICIIIIYFFEFDEFLLEEKTGDVVTKARHSSNALNHALRGVMWGLSLVMVPLIYVHYRKLLDIEKVLKLRHEKETVKTSGLWKKMVAEQIFSVLICPPLFDVTIDMPNINDTYPVSIDALIFTVTLLKLYHILRLYEPYSRWTSKTAKMECNKEKCENGLAFIVKCELKHRPYTMVMILLILVMVIMGSAIRIYELTYPGGEQWLYFNAFWCMMVTMTTVGYGDFYPNTHFGRVIAFIGCLIGTVLTSLMVISLSNTSEFNEGEGQVYLELQKNYQQDNSKKSAAFLLKIILETNQLTQEVKKRAGDKKSTKHHMIEAQMMKQFSQLQQLRKQVGAFQIEQQKLASYQDTTESKVAEWRKRMKREIEAKASEKEVLDHMEANLVDIKLSQQGLMDGIQEHIAWQQSVAAFIVKCSNPHVSFT